MREILFRAKRRDNKQWVKGSLLFYPDVNRAFMSLGEFKGGSFIEVFKDTVGQFTGLADKNDKGVFEGDIVKMFYKDGFEIGVIGWSNIDLRYKFASPDGTAYGFDVTDTIEVIGNIHDNPELLKEGAE